VRKGRGKGPQDRSRLNVTLDRLRSVEADARKSDPAKFERELGLLPRRSLRLVRKPEDV
jgi:hypothetical protein